MHAFYHFSIPQQADGVFTLRENKLKIFKQLNNLDLYNLRSAEGLILPKTLTGYLNLGSLTSTKGLTLPQAMKDIIWLNSLDYKEKEELKKRYPKLNII